MNRGRNCKEFFDDDERAVVYDDPSPSGISLPPGETIILASCPYCGSEDYEENFSLIDKIEMEENDASLVTISFEGKSFQLYLDEFGELDILPPDPAEEKDQNEKKGKAREVA